MKATAKRIVAAIAAALAAGTAAAAPALALATPKDEQDAVTIVAQSVGSDDAIDAAVYASPLTWADVASVDWCYDCCHDDYVVTLTAYWGDVWTVWVDAQTGVGYSYA